MREEIICAGFGGQGIMVMGRLLACSAMCAGLEVTWMPSYGAEVRGGTAHSMIVISDTPIAFPLVSKPTSCLVMNQPSLERFEESVVPEGLMVLNSSLIELQPERKNILIIKIPATEIASNFGNIKVANMVILGAYVTIKNFLKLEVLIESLSEVIPGYNTELLNINKKALREGAKLVNEARTYGAKRT